MAGGGGGGGRGGSCSYMWAFLPTPVKIFYPVSTLQYGDEDNLEIDMNINICLSTPSIPSLPSLLGLVKLLILPSFN